MSRHRFKYLMRERISRSALGDETLLSISEHYGVKPRAEAFEDEEHQSRAESLEGYRNVKRGDLVMNYMLAWKGAYGVSDYDGIVSPAYAVFDIDQRRVDRRYIHYHLRSEPMRALFRAHSKGIIESRLRLYPDNFLALEVNLPDIDTQKQIADFLDHETARIDQLIETKQRMVALLAEKRSLVALVCLSDGLSSFGWQPERRSFAFQFKQKGWIAMRVKSLVSFMTSGSRGWSNMLGTEGEVFIQSGNIGRHMEVDLDSAQRVRPQTGAEAERTLVKKNDVLVCITGGRTGAVGYVRDVDERAYINQHVCLLRARRDVMLPELLAHILWSEIGQKQIAFCQYGVKQGLGFNEVANLQIPVPPTDLQHKLVAQIETQTARLDKLTDAIMLSVDRLHEVRSAIIAEAVAGNVSTSQKRGSSKRRMDVNGPEVTA